MATMMLTLAALAWLMASCVCGMMPSSAAMTMTAMSRDLRAARAHGRKRRVAGRIQERNLVSGVLDAVRADMLGDAARFACRDAGLADGVHQRGLAVIDVAP